MEKIRKLKDQITSALNSGIKKVKYFLLNAGTKVKKVTIKGYTKFIALPKYMKNVIVYLTLVAVIFGGATWFQRSQAPFNIITTRPPVEEPDEEHGGPTITLPEKPEDVEEPKVPDQDQDQQNQDEDLDQETVADSVFNISNEMIWPIDGLRTIEGKFREEFQYRDNGRPYFLEGVVIAAPKGSNVRAALPGEVKHIAYSDLYGKVVNVEFEDPDKVLWECIYYNLDSIQVELGQRLTVGDSIGTVGTNYLNQKFNEEHLYLELKKNNENVDPELFFN